MLLSRGTHTAHDHSAINVRHPSRFTGFKEMGRTVFGGRGKSLNLSLKSLPLVSLTAQALISLK